MGEKKTGIISLTEPSWEDYAIGEENVENRKPHWVFLGGMSRGWAVEKTR